jgi:hypothetical protein
MTLERHARVGVGLGIAGELGLPIVKAASWQARKPAARMLVPKAALHHDDLASAGAGRCQAFLANRADAA